MRLLHNQNLKMILQKDEIEFLKILIEKMGGSTKLG